ncbi:MAG: DUF945 family protein [Woeseiaceae bacterium]|nr:DUF945 family protein [Woeseiaceae bacterium]
MNRWLVALLIALALIRLLSPGIVGRLAEKNIDRSLARVDLENENLAIESQRFERGWFTSEGRHRIELTSGALADAVRADEASGAPAIVVETRVDHGIVPLSSMGRERGSLNPALASAVSRLTLERGDGDAVDFPGRVYTFVGLTGATTYRFLLDPGSDVAGNTRTSWQSADLSAAVSADGRERSLQGTIDGPVVIEAFDVATRIGPVSIDSFTDRGAHPLGEGHLSFELESLRMSDVQAEDLLIGPLSVASRRAIDDGRVSGRIEFRLEAERAVDGGPLDVGFVLDYADLDANRVKDAMDAIRRSVADSIGARRLPAKPRADGLLIRLAAGGGSAELKDLVVELPDGAWQMNATVSIEPSPDVTSSADWASLLLSTTARVDARISDSLFQRMTVTSPDLQSAVAGGFLVRRDDGYEIEALLDGGRVTVNGAPVADIAALFGAPR